ncbi:MAG TPA: hypothetical protein VEX65_05010 [Flavisolibacter sp.]|nr:hypothetical protein [Flavisolibacter sp.]
MLNQAYHLGQCRRLIEEKLAWGSSEYWQNQDYERLSERIFEITNTTLSVSTLKRVWGKVHYTSSPNLSTLNALAQFAGYENWRSFVSENVQASVAPAPETAGEPVPPKPVATRKWSFAFWAVSIALLLGLVVLWAFQDHTKRLTYSNIKFTSAPTTVGLPNTVIFQYDAKDSNADSVFIQQSWDPGLRFRVDKNKNEYASTYYYPGFYKAKLILNDSVVKEHDLYVETNDWLGTVDNNPVPSYFTKDQIIKKEGVGIYEEDVHARGLDFKNESPQISLFYINKNIAVRSDNFSFKTKIKSNYNRGDAICQMVNIILLCQNGYHSIPLSIKGCVGELTLVLGNRRHTGNTTNLSRFGVNFSDWVKVDCKVTNKHARILINDQLAYEGDMDNDPGKIVGFRYRFTGAGMVKDHELEQL